MRIALTSVMVDDQAKALKFYTEILGWVTKRDIPMGGGARWLTVTSPEGHPDVELLLEPMGFAEAKTFQKTMLDKNIPATAFANRDVKAEYERLKAKGMKFKTPPTPAGPTIMAVFEDTCGNLIQIFQA